MLLKENVDVTRVNTFASNAIVRMEVDLGEIPSDELAAVWDLKKLGHQECAVIIGTNGEMAILNKLARLYDKMPELKELVDSVE